MRLCRLLSDEGSFRAVVGKETIAVICAMKEQMEVSIRVTPQQAFDFIKQQVDANEGFDEDTRPVRVHDSAYLKQLLES